ncbi:hypothetical protein GCM10022290_36730 [Sagittula marina]
MEPAQASRPQLRFGFRPSCRTVEIGPLRTFERGEVGDRSQPISHLSYVRAVDQGLPNTAAKRGQATNDCNP